MLKIVFVVLIVCYYGCTPGIAQKVNPGRPINIKIQSRSKTTSDSLNLVYYENPIETRLLSERVKTTTMNSKGEWVFELESIKIPVYISLFSNNKSSRNKVEYIFKLYLAEPGDDITVEISDKNSEKGKSIKYLLSFKGEGSPKYNCRNEIDKSIENSKGDYELFDSTSTLFNKNNQYDIAHLGVKKTLLKYKAVMSMEVFNITLVDYFAMIETERLNRIQREVFMISKFDSGSKEKIVLDYKKKITQFESRLTHHSKELSGHYFKFVVDKESTGKRTGLSRKVRPVFIQDVYQKIKANYKGELRDKAITFFLLEQRWSNKIEMLVAEALQIVQTDYCINELELYITQNARGKPAFNFSLPDTSGRLITLEDFRGKVVLLDFWFNGCSGCAQYYTKHVSIAEEIFKDNKDVVFVTVSIDSKKSKWLDGITSNKYTAKHAVNLYTDGKGENHPVVKNYRVTSYPWPLLIDRQGNIFSNDISELRTGGSEKLIETINRALAQ